MSATELYDFESAIEAGVKAALVAAGLTVSIPTDVAAFQKVRPRCDVTFQTGAEKKSYHRVNDVLRNASWSGNLSVEVVTGQDVTEHRTYRATVRKILADLRGSFSMTYLKIQNITDTGTSGEIKWEDGYRTSKMSYSIEFGIDAAAWAVLTA